MGEMPLVQHISDPALWSAIHQAKESERPDPQFRDPFARRLAGDRGEQIAAGLAFSEADSWSWMARTYLFDNLITERVRRGADMVLNLGSGVDTRAFRMAWPDSLIWIDVDLPDILDYKQGILAAEKQHCKVEYVPLDLADVSALRHLSIRLGTGPPTLSFSPREL
jgi:methyltransferase (TIGR00027 family)